MMNKTQSLKDFVYLVGLHIYYKMIHGPYNIKLVYGVSVTYYQVYDSLQLKWPKSILLIGYSYTSVA